MNDTHLSKLLSLVLRHQPDELGLTLDEAGWTDVAVLLTQLQRKDATINFERLKHIVDTSEKKRFAFSDDFRQLRASQGHSVAIDLQLTPTEPPEHLYHGTASTSLDIILREGIQKRSRQHVHLSTDPATALKVGQRHGKPRILRVDSGTMHRVGLLFYISDNRVWLTDFVAPDYLTVVENPA